MLMLERHGVTVVDAVADVDTAPAVSGLRWTTAARVSNVELASANMFSSMSMVRIMLS